MTYITLYNDGGWKKRAHRGTLYPVTPDELRGWCEGAGLVVDDVWGSYARDALDPARSTDVLLVATKK